MERAEKVPWTTVPEFCPVDVLSKVRTDITPLDFAGAPMHQGARLLPNFYLVRVPFYSARSKRSFLAIPLPTDSQFCSQFLAGPLRLCESFSRAFDVSLQHVRARALLPHHHDRRAWLLQITQIILSDLRVRYAWNVPKNPIPPFLLCVRCRALSSRRCLIS